MSKKHNSRLNTLCETEEDVLQTIAGFYKAVEKYKYVIKNDILDECIKDKVKIQFESIIDSLYDEEADKVVYGGEKRLKKKD